jgi:hypothetical protein
LPNFPILEKIFPIGAKIFPIDRIFGTSVPANKVPRNPKIPPPPSSVLEYFLSCSSCLNLSSVSCLYLLKLDKRALFVSTSDCNKSVCLF